MLSSSNKKDLGRDTTIKNKEKWERPRLIEIDIHETNSGSAPAGYEDTFVYKNLS